MNILKLYTEEYDPGVTLVSNVFIDYFLKDANDAQLKVYLYLVRHISNHKPFTISNIADEFNHTEKDVIRALMYWEEKQVLSLEYDGNNEIVGIEFNQLTQDSLNRSAKLYAMPLPASSEKAVSSDNASHTYTSSDFVKMNKEEDWIAIKSLCECYFGRTLSPSDLQTLAYIYKDLGFSPFEVDSLIDNCLSNGKKTMRAIKKCAEEAAAEKITNPDVSDIMNALGETGVPTKDQLDIINRWLSEMNRDLILEGCRKATLKTTSNRFGYAEGIFKHWKSQNITSVAEMAASEEAFRQNAETRKRTSSRETSNKFKQFAPTQYDFSQLEKEAGIN